MSTGYDQSYTKPKSPFTSTDNNLVKAVFAQRSIVDTSPSKLPFTKFIWSGTPCGESLKISYLIIKYLALKTSSSKWGNLYQKTAWIFFLNLLNPYEISVGIKMYQPAFYFFYLPLPRHSLTCKKQKNFIFLISGFFFI